MKQSLSMTADVSKLLDQSRWLSGLARQLVADASSADDLVQDTLLAAMESPRKPQDSGLRAWLATIMRNKAISGQRSSGRRRRREWQAAREEGLPGPDELAEALEGERLLRDALDNLSEPYKHAILLRYREGLSAAEIARQEGCPAGTVRWRIKTGLEQLRIELTRRDSRWALVMVPLSTLPGPPAALVGGSLVSGAALPFGWLAFVLAACVIPVLVLEPWEEILDVPSNAMETQATSQDQEVQTVDLISTDHRVPIAADEVTPKAEVSEVFVGEIFTSEESLSGFGMNGVITIADGNSASVQETEGIESIQFVSFAALSSERLIEPMALRGDEYEVRDGKWSMPIPEKKLLVAKFTHLERSMSIVRGRVILPGSTSATIEVESAPQVRVEVVDFATGVALDQVELVAHPVQVAGRLYSAVIPKGTMAPPREENNSPVKTCVAPPSYADALVSGGASPILVPQFGFTQRLWVHRNGYQWEYVDVDNSTRQCTVRLRPSRSLRIHADQSGYYPWQLTLSVFRGAKLIAVWKGVEPASDFELTDIGLGEYRVSLHRRRARNTEIADEKLVTIDSTSSASVSLLASKETEKATGSLRIEIKGCEPPYFRFGRRLLPSYRVQRVSDQGSGYLGTGPSGLVEDLSHVPGSGRIMLAGGLWRGKYLVELSPYGLRTTVEIKEGVETTVQFDATELGLLEIWPDLDGVSATKAEEVKSLELIWEREDEQAGVNIMALRSSGRRRAKGCWTIWTTPGRIRYYLVGRDERIWHTGVAEIQVGENLISQTFAAPTTPTAIVRLTGISSDESGMVLGQARLAPDGRLGEGVLVTRYSWSQGGDTTFNMELHFAVPEEFLTAPLELSVPASTMEFKQVSSTSPVLNRQRKMDFAIIRD